MLTRLWNWDLLRASASSQQHLGNRLPRDVRLHQRQKGARALAVLQLQKYSVDGIRLAFPRDATFPYFRFWHQA
jgi:hypothetical protein